MTWVYNDSPIEELDDTYCGFVYLIINKLNNKQYKDFYEYVKERQ